MNVGLLTVISRIKNCTGSNMAEAINKTTKLGRLKWSFTHYRFLAHNDLLVN